MKTQPLYIYNIIIRYADFFMENLTQELIIAMPIYIKKILSKNFR